jgi:ATP-binding cassette subfamily B protein
VDIKTERAIVEAMERLVRGRTTFIITHRPSTLKHCDLVLRMEGRLVALEPARDRSAFETHEVEFQVEAR